MSDKLLNIYANETPPRLMTHHNHENDRWHVAEELNGRLAMIGFNILIINYVLSGNIIPGIF